MDSYYVKTDDVKFHVSDIVEVSNWKDGVVFLKDTEDRKIGLFIPSISLEYYFICSDKKYQTLPIDLKRGCIHI